MAVYKVYMENNKQRNLLPTFMSLCCFDINNNNNRPESAFIHMFTHLDKFIYLQMFSFQQRPHSVHTYTRTNGMEDVVKCTLLINIDVHMDL